MSTNPYWTEVDGVSILGSSGQNVDDISRNSTIDDPLDALECLLRWCHLAPTAPDTLACFPFKEKDPFTIDQSPHVMFVGNQDCFRQR